MSLNSPTPCDAATTLSKPQLQPSTTYHVVHIQSEPPRRPFNGLNSKTVIRNHKSPDRLPVVTATKRAEAIRVARDRVSKSQQWEWKPELAKLLLDCRYAKPLYNTVTHGVGHTPIKANADESFCSHPPEPVVRVAAEQSVKTYTLELDVRLQVRGGVTHLALPKARNYGSAPHLIDREQAQLRQCWRFGREMPEELSEQHREELRSASWKRQHEDILHTLEVLRECPSPALADVGALLLRGDPVADFAEWLVVSACLDPGTPRADAPKDMIFTCRPSSAIANCSDNKHTRITLNAKSLRFDYRRPVSVQRWIASGETRSWLTLGAMASTHDDEVRFMGLGKTFMSWEQEDRTDGLANEIATLEFDTRSWEMVDMARVQARHRELQRKLSSHGDKSVLADVGIRYARGMTQQAIAATLGMDLATVDRHIAWCHSKLGWLCFYRGVSKEIIRESVWRNKPPATKPLAPSHLAVLRENSVEIRPLMVERSMDDDSSARRY